MKKTLTIIILCIVFALIYLLQMNFFSWFTIAGVKPNLFVILILFIGLYTGRRVRWNNGSNIWFFSGHFRKQCNRANSSNIWDNSDLCGGYLEKNLSKDSKITVILLCMGATAICEIFGYIYRSTVLETNVELWIFVKILGIEILYNGLLTIILYPLMQKIGYKIEDIFKNPQILTRYF